MIKVIYCISKKRGLSDDEFFRYWESVHGPLGARIPLLRRLVQCHRINVPGDQRPPDYDGVAELWFDDVNDLLSARESPEWQTATADEVNFVDHKNVAYLVSEENEVTGD